MKRMLAASLILALLGPAALAAGPEEDLWSRKEGDGSYVTVRVPYPEGEELNWSEKTRLLVRYADTGEPVALTSDYWRGSLFATVPAAEAGRPLEVVRGEEHHFPDCITVWNEREYYEEPVGAGELYLRGVLRGDQAGRLNPEAVLTRAEAFALIARLLTLEPEGESGYTDVSPSDWYYETAGAVRAAGIAAADERFHPERPVTRAEVTAIVARAMERMGWLDQKRAAEEDPSDWYEDAALLPAWAVEDYVSLARSGAAAIQTWNVVGTGEDGGPVYQLCSESDKPATRGEIVEFLSSVLQYVPCYPTGTAIEWGFDREMPVVDGSTSSYPYTEAIYGTFFINSRNHLQFPRSHSKSHESYERLIGGEVDLLFAATLPSEELKEQAKAAGVELEFIPIACDAMVFFTNAENPVSGLTRAQIQDIYVRGAYDNWKQVGGPDAALLPYRRNADSGSHALMERYFLEGGRLSLSPDVHNVLTSYAMSSALTDVASALRTDPPAYAMGYSVYAYYQNSYWLLADVPGDSRELKLLAIDGVLPTEETIADGSYPLSDYNYVVLRADEPEDSSARRLAEFMCSEEGQACVSAAGFQPLRQEKNT